MILLISNKGRIRSRSRLRAGPRAYPQAGRPRGRSRAGRPARGARPRLSFGHNFWPPVCRSRRRGSSATSSSPGATNLRGCSLLQDTRSLLECSSSTRQEAFSGCTMSDGLIAGCANQNPAEPIHQQIHQPPSIFQPQIPQQQPPRQGFQVQQQVSSDFKRQKVLTASNVIKIVQVGKQPQKPVIIVSILRPIGPVRIRT